MGTAAIILSAGSGHRMELNYNKQFLEIFGKPLLYYTIKAFSDEDEVDQIIIVAKEEEVHQINENIIHKYNFNKVSKVVVGGKRRQDSVFNGLKSLENTDIVLIHDGARAFVGPKTIKDGIFYAKKYGAATPGVIPKDTINIRDENGFLEGTLNREKLFLVQTPQCFKFSEILKAHSILSLSDETVTDDTYVFNKYIGKVYLYFGEYDNIKVTTKEDISIATKIIENRSLTQRA